MAEAKMYRPWLKHYPEGFTLNLNYPEIPLYEILRHSAEWYPEKTALIFYGNEINYKQLKEAVDRLATFLHKSDVKKGDRVGIYMLNSPQWVISFFAILKVGGVVVPINPLMKGNELDYIIKDAGINILIAGAELYGNVKNSGLYSNLKKIIMAYYIDYLPKREDLPIPDFMKVDEKIDCDICVQWGDALKEYNPPEVKININDLAMIPYTAGSTGMPKGCMHTNFTVMSNILSAAYWERMSSAAVHLSALPFFHVTGLVHCLLAPIYSSSTVVIVSKWDRMTALGAIEKYKITHWISIATMVFDVLAYDKLKDRDLKSLRVTGGGGMPMPKAVAEKWEEITGTKYMEGYGLTETISQTHLNPLEKPKYGSIGIPDFNVDALVVDVEKGVALKPKEIGEIVLKGPEVFLGYWNKKDETERAFVEIDGDIYFRTGDIGYMDEDGFFFVVDRVKRMINRAGFKVWPADVESKLYEHPAIKEAVIVGTPDDRVGEEVKAFVVLKPEFKGKISEEDIISWAKKRMASYKYPRKVEFMESLPKSGAGKINWRILQEQEINKGKKGEV